MVHDTYLHDFSPIKALFICAKNSAVNTSLSDMPEREIRPQRGRDFFIEI